MLIDLIRLPLYFKPVSEYTKAGERMINDYNDKYFFWVLEKGIHGRPDCQHTVLLY